MAPILSPTVLNSVVAVNIFSEALPLVPRISVESVVRGNPDVIIATGMANERPEWLDDWLVWPDLSAVKSNSLHSINPGLDRSS